MHRRCRPAHCAALAGSVEMLRALRSERGNLWLASHVTGNYPLHEAAVARRIGRYERIRHFACLGHLVIGSLYLSSVHSVLALDHCRHYSTGAGAGSYGFCAAGSGSGVL